MSEVVSQELQQIAHLGARMSASDANSLYYRARGADVDLHIVPSREGAHLALCGQVLPRSGSHSDTTALNIEVLDHLGIVASAAPNREGVFQFTGLSCGVYHMRVSTAEWKVGIFGITA